MLQHSSHRTAVCPTPNVKTENKATHIADGTDVFDETNHQSIPDIPIAEGTTEVGFHGKSDVCCNERLKHKSDWMQNLQTQ